jgi:hypothetical protein
MAGQQDGATLIGEMAQESAHPVDASRIETVNGLIEDQYLGITEEGGNTKRCLMPNE